MERKNLPNSSLPLIFFFKGEKVPKYASLSMADAVEKWNGPVIFLTDSEAFEAPPGVSVVRFPTFYDESRFLSFRAASSLDEGFRDGFWLHTAERFFVLHQYCLLFDVQHFVHMELDVILLGSGFSPSFLFDNPPGLFYPSGSRGHAGASIIAVTCLKTLEAFIDFCSENAAIGDEMALLWKFQRIGRKDVYQLPSHTHFETPVGNETPRAISPVETRGLFDVQPFGTWLLGQDPRNIPKGPQMNRFFFEGIGSGVLRDLEFSYNPFLRRLSVRSKGGALYEILCLHVHSKNISMALNPLMMSVLTLLSRLPLAIPLSHKNLSRFVSRRLKERVDVLYSLLRSMIGRLFSLKLRKPPMKNVPARKKNHV
jgi:hypothetical protein